VRTIRVADYSFELCGGTHCRATGQIGGFVITGERSIGANQRRIEALTGAGADSWLRSRSDLVDEAAEALGAQTPAAIRERIAALQADLREARRRLRTGAGGGAPTAKALAAGAQDLDGTRVVAAAGAWPSIDELKASAKALRGILGPGVIALALEADEPQLFVTVSDDLVTRGVAAGDLVRVGAAAIDGRGGGRPEMAQARGTRREGIDAALEAIRTALRAALARGD
jgi:alanyl-tRNA synthetase